MLGEDGDRLPKKVIAILEERDDLHGDCLTDIGYCCDECKQKVYDAFDQVYGQSSSGADLVRRMLVDLLEDYY
jgi:hypothetical protein